MAFNNWLQLWDDNPLQVVKDPEYQDQMSYLFGNGVEMVRIYKTKIKLCTKRRENLKQRNFSSVSH
jgi:hypothetical protein